MSPLDLAAAVPDPRVFPALADAPAEDLALYRLADQSLQASTRQEAEAADAALARSLATRLAGDGPALAALIEGAPAVTIARHLWRQVDRLCAQPAADGTLAVSVFALPLVLVAGIEAARGEATLPGTLADAARVVDLLREHGALAGNQSIGLANALVGVDAIDLPRLPGLLAWQRLPEAFGAAPPVRVVAPRPLAVSAAGESVHLRFLVGSALARPGAELFGERGVGAWGLPLARELGGQLAAGPITVLALPRAPRRPPAAVEDGRAAQREISAQLFASNAIRKLRASVGEPCAVISAHRAADARAQGELRVSLSSPFEPRDAEGFRCPLFAPDRIGDVAALLVRLLQDCRVADIRLLDGIHPDRVPGMTHPLLFKPDTIPLGAELRLH
ncbi:MAG: hypothetical protein IPO82_13045 [Betaproteobacteria bacterium]|nr:hypothetical protein [Betaproteobacteria bacterium]